MKNVRILGLAALLVVSAVPAFAQTGKTAPKKPAVMKKAAPAKAAPKTATKAAKTAPKKAGKPMMKAAPKKKG